MPRNQDRYTRSPKKITIGGRQVMVSADSSLEPEVIALMADHQAALAERIGEEYHLRGGCSVHSVYSKSLIAALRAKGLIQKARARSSNNVGDHANNGGAPRNPSLNSSQAAA